MAKFDINARYFGHNGSNSIKGKFLDSFYQNLLMIYNLFVFLQRFKFGCFSNDVICNY